jgi:hypothetical protein
VKLDVRNVRQIILTFLVYFSPVFLLLSPVHKEELTIHTLDVSHYRLVSY